MGKQPLSWHEECYQNNKSFVAELEQAYYIARIRFEQSYDALQFYKKQIEEAKHRKLDGFDRERFLKAQKTWGCKSGKTDDN